MPLRGSVALVTGGGGFVGANLVRRLIADGARVHAIVRHETDLWRLEDVRTAVTLHIADLTDRSAVLKIVSAVRPDVLFHLAKHRGNPATIDYESAYATNLHATLHLLEAAAGVPMTRFVHAGSSLEYDLTRSPLRETDAPAPRTVHGVTKAAAALLCQHFARERGVPAVVLRLFTVYGPWEGPARFVPAVMLAALDRRPLAVTEGSLAHDWIFVDDVVEACVRSVSAPGITGDILNVATGRQTTNEEIVRLVEELDGAPIARVAAPFPPRAWDTAAWVADVSSAAERLRWRAETSVADGLAQTLGWFRSHAALYRERVT